MAWQAFRQGLKQIQQQRSLRLAGSWETSTAVAREIAEMVTYDLPDDHLATYAGKIRALTVDEVSAAAAGLVHPDKLVWVIVGDRQAIEPGIRKLGWGDIRFIDADGEPIGDGAPVEE